MCQDHGHPQTFWFAADISKAEDKTLNKEKVISSCSTLKGHRTELQKTQHIQPLHHNVAAHKISPNPVLSSIQQLCVLEEAVMSLRGNRIGHCQEGVGTARREWALSGGNGHCEGNAASFFMFLELSISSFNKQRVLQLHQCSTSFGSCNIPPHTGRCWHCPGALWWHLSRDTGDG